VTDGTERQIIKGMEGNNQRPKIKYCSICDRFVFILREDDTIDLFTGEPERGKIRRKDMSPMGEKVRFSHVLYLLLRMLIMLQKASRYIAGFIFQRYNWHVQNSHKRERTRCEWRRTACYFNSPSRHDRWPKDPVAYVV
jgi:hypothetical protein